MMSDIRSFGAVSFALGASVPRDRDRAYYERFFGGLPGRGTVLTRLDVGGRGGAVLYRHDGRELLWRHYRRGGWWGRLMGDRYVRGFPTAERARRELVLLQELRACGLPVPAPFLARWERHGCCVRNDLVVEVIPRTHNLAQILRARPLPPADWRRLGRVLRRFFAAGVIHTDLNLRNILQDDNGDFFVIDFDRCRRVEALGASRRRQMLARLARSLRKELKMRPALHYQEENFAVTAREALKLEPCA